MPLETEERSTLDPSTLPPSRHQVEARSILDTSRHRALDDARIFGEWILAQPDPSRLRDQPPTDVTLDHLHQRLLSALVRPIRPVTRPTTAATWAERLGSVFPSRLHSRFADRWIRGLRALAPAAPSVQRGTEEAMTAAAAEAQERASDDATDVRQRRLWTAVWLAVQAMIRGMRPLPSLRASLPQSTRTLKDARPPALPTITVEVLLDKDNAVGSTPAPRVRDIPVPRCLLPSLRMLPYPNDRDSLKVLGMTRTNLLRSHGVTDARAPRRDAGARADREGLEPHLVLNHAPGSAHDATYVGAVTSAATRRQLQAW